MNISSSKLICIIGYLYNQDKDTCELKSVFINDGKITKIIDGRPETELIANNFIIELGDDEVILPTLINLHTHIGYNVLPIWNSPSVWKNRHQWRNNPKYNAEIKEFMEFIKDGWQTNTRLVSNFISDYIDESKFADLFLETNLSYLELYKAYAISEIQRIHAILSEIQAVAGGTGLLLQTLDLDKEEPSMKHFLIRNTGNAEDIGIEKSHKIFPVVDFYKPNVQPSGAANEDTSLWTALPYKDSLSNYTKSVNDNNKLYYSTIAHIGEGKTGNLYGATKDVYSKNESNLLLKHLRENVDPEKLKESNLVLVHANGIDYSDKQTSKFLRDNNISIVWSPVSNLLLYNDTLPIKTILEENINVCLGTDWTPSGSKHILDEMKFARHFGDKFGLGIKDLDIFKMASSNGAKALGNLNYSKVSEGAFADLFVYKVKDKNKPIDSIMTDGDDKIKFCMINGRIIYGDIPVFDNMGVDYQKFPDAEGTASKKKAISINSSVNFNLENSIRKMDELIRTYSKDTLQHELFRTKFLSVDDKTYSDRIQELKLKL